MIFGSSFDITHSYSPLICQSLLVQHHAFSFIRFSTKKMNSSASSIVPKCTFSVRLLSNSTPTSMPTSSTKFSDNLRILKPSSFSFMITFFLGSSNSSTFLSIVKQSRMGMQSRCDFCSLHRNRLFCRMSMSLSGSPMRSFSCTIPAKGSKVALRWADLHPKPMNSASLSLRTEAKVRYQVGTASSSIQNLSSPFEHSDSLQTRVNLSWNSMMFFCSCSRIQPSRANSPSHAFRILFPHRTVTSSVASNLSTKTISFSRRSLLSAIFSQNLSSFWRWDSASSSSVSMSLRSSLQASRYMSYTALRAGSSIFSIQLVSTRRLSTSPVLSSVSSRTTRSKDSQMKWSLGFLVRSSLAMDLKKEPQRVSVSSKQRMKSLMKFFVYSIFQRQSVCNAPQMRTRQRWLIPRACTYCFSFYRFSFFRYAKATWNNCCSMDGAATTTPDYAARSYSVTYDFMI